MEPLNWACEARQLCDSPSPCFVEEESGGYGQDACPELLVIWSRIHPRCGGTY